LKKLYSCLETKGLLIIRVPNAESPLFSGKVRYSDFTHEIGFDQTSIKTVLREAGLKDIICFSTKFYFGSLLSIPSTIIRKLGNSVLKLYMASYIGKGAANIIFTPAFITIARK
jgi:hypothetical protein